MLRIVPYPHPALRYESRPIERIDDALRTAVRQMFNLMYEHRGIGLAANQVGLPYRFFILNLTADPAQPEKEQVFLNPEIVKRHASVEDEEGCLSFPGLYTKVSRARKIRLKAYDLQGNEVELDAEDLYSRAIQHESDHLAGRLYIDYVNEETKSTLAPKIREFETRFRQAQESGEYPSDEEIARQLQDLAAGRAPWPLEDGLT